MKRNILIKFYHLDRAKGLRLGWESQFEGFIIQFKYKY